MAGMAEWSPGVAAVGDGRGRSADEPPAGDVGRRPQSPATCSHPAGMKNQNPEGSQHVAGD